MYGFCRKIFLMLYYLKWPNFITWLPLLPEILGNMCILILFFPVCEAINFKIYPSLLIKAFSYMTKKIETNFKYPEKEKSSKYKVFFITFKGLPLKQIKPIFLKGGSRTFISFMTKTLIFVQLEISYISNVCLVSLFKNYSFIISQKVKYALSQ